MEPAQLSIPLGELSAAVTLGSTLAAFGGSYQILPESEAPLTALLGRNGALFGTPVNSKAATVLLRTVPLTIGFTPDDQFAVIDQRKPADQGVLYTPYGADPGPSTQYGLLTVLSGTDRFGKRRRTIQVTGTGTSAALQSAIEFFLFGGQHAGFPPAPGRAGHQRLPAELPGGHPLHHLRPPPYPVPIPDARYRR